MPPRHNNPVLDVLGVHRAGDDKYEGRRLLRGKGITVDSAGNIAADAIRDRALNALRAIQTFDDKKQGMLDAMAYSASVGVTTNVDMGAFILPGTPNAIIRRSLRHLGKLGPLHRLRSAPRAL